mgnify:CR=1 FL=1|tara:strand:- start:15868 stop:16680 length:813 start_codon:yes stop_codon:yes gene_type:complete
MLGDSITVHSDGRTSRWSEADEIAYAKLVKPLLRLISEKQTGDVDQYLHALTDKQFHFVINRAVIEIIRACIESKKNDLLQALLNMEFIQDAYNRNAKTKQSHLLIAIKEGHRPTFSVLLKYRQNSLALKDNEAMRTAVTHGQLDILLILLKDKHVVEDIQAHDNIALKEAVREGNLQCAAVLCEFGACVSALGFSEQQKVKDQYLQMYKRACPENIVNWAVHNTYTMLFGSSPPSSPSGSETPASSSESLTDDEGEESSHSPKCPSNRR